MVKEGWKFLVEVKDHKTGVVTYTRDLGPNTLLNTGKAYMEDMCLGLANWRDPSSESTPWSDMQDIYIHVGDNMDTNAGVVGPSGSVAVLASGAWQGVDPEDFRLSHRIAGKQVDSITRADGSIFANIKATFTDAELGTGGVTIKEMAIGLNNAEPDAKPMYDYDERPKAILVRKVLYTTSGAYYIESPIERVTGQDITLTHVFGSIDA